MTRDTAKNAPDGDGFSDQNDPLVEAGLTAHTALDDVRDSGAARLAVAACTTLVAAALVWASHVEVAEKVTGTGTIEPQGKLERIEHPDGGVVRKLSVQENTIVAPGDVLLTFDTDQIQREAEALAVRIHSLEQESRRVRFLLETDGTVLPEDRETDDAAAAAFWAEQVFLVAQLQSIDAENNRLASQEQSTGARIEILKKEQRIVSEQLQRYNNFVDSGTVRLLDRERLQREELQLSSELEAAEGRLSELNGARAENARRRDELLAQRRRDAAVRWTRIEEELATLRQGAADAAARLERAEVRSEAGGQVHRLDVLRAREVVAPGDLIAEIVPAGTAYRAVLNVSADTIGAIRPGMSVKLKVVSYDFTRFGAITADVSEVSPTSFMNEQGDVVYRVTVNLPDTVPTGEAEVAVRPGMTVTGDILTGERTILSYLLHPLRKIQDQSLSET